MNAEYFFKGIDVDPEQKAIFVSNIDPAGWVFAYLRYSFPTAKAIELIEVIYPELIDDKTREYEVEVLPLDFPSFYVLAMSFWQLIKKHGLEGQEDFGSRMRKLKETRPFVDILAPRPNDE